MKPRCRNLDRGMVAPMNPQQLTAKPAEAPEEFVAAFNEQFVETGLVEATGEYRDGKPLYRATRQGRKHLAQARRQERRERRRRFLRR
jgi:hypothetical protein